MKKWYGLIWLIFIIFLSIYLESPTKVRPAETKGFSALNAKPHIDTMASEFHFIGSEANKKVKEYIVDEFNKLGIQTEIYTGYCETRFRNSHKKMAVTENIIATIPGIKNSKSVVIAGHYDSVLSAPGAADDVHAVACMLEVAKLLKQREYYNDIQFLITDGEEMGLLGAKAFVENKNTDSIGVLFNYEARGNSGAGFFFEWSDGNSWLASQLKKATHKPVTNSLAYEIYKTLPNDSDFTHFKKAGIRGVNHAFIDGFSYYHNPADSPENINLNSVQHTGENMFLLVDHFANLDLTQVDDSKDGSFFNFLGFLLVYPTYLDLVMLFGIVVFLLFSFYYSLKATFTISQFLWSLLAVIFCIVASIVINIGLSILLFKIYPHYDVFYTGQFYNHKWYILCSMGIALLCVQITHYIFKNKTTRHSSLFAGMFTLLALGTTLYLKSPTASYVINFPLLVMSIQATLNIIDFKKSNFLNILRSTFAMAVWAPLLVTLFLAFSIKLLFVPALVTLCIVLAAMTFYNFIWENPIIKYIGASLFLIGFIIAHMFSQPTEKKPLPSNMYYAYDVVDSTAYWLSDQDKLNIGHPDVINNAQPMILELPYPRRCLAAETHINPELIMPILKIDSLSNRQTFVHPQRALKTMVYIENASNIKDLKFNDKSAISTVIDNEFIADIYGMGLDSLSIDITKVNENEMCELKFNFMYEGMPKHEKINSKALRTGNYTSIIHTNKI